MATISYGTFTITNELDGSQFWTTVVEPVSPDYTFTISDLVGDTNADIKVGDIILFSHYRYTVLNINQDGTTVRTGNRESLRGVDGISPTVKSIVCSHAAVVCEKDGAYNPDTIKFSGQAIFENNINDYQGWFVIELSSDSETWVSNYTSASKESFVNYKIPLGLNITKDGILYYQGSDITTNGSIVDANFTISSEGVISTTQDIGFIIRSIRCSLYSDANKTDLVDQQRVNIAFDGVDGDKGDDGYSVILTNENHTFAGNTTSAVNASTECEVIAYKGGQKIITHIGTIEGCPQGMTVSIPINDATNSKFIVNVTTQMTTQNGVLNVPITVDDKTFNMKFTYSLKLNGLDSTGLGWMVNYSTPTTPNDGECIYFGFDEATKEPSFDVDGWVLWNGNEITIPHGCHINPDQTMPYNTVIYNVYRLPDATTYTSGTFHDVAWIESSNTWKSNTYNGVAATADSAEWVWHEDTDIILAMYVEPSNEGTITNAQLFTPPKKFSELTETAKGMAKEAEKVAYHYLRIDESGAMVANMTDDSGMQYTPSNIPTGKKNILITANELKIRDGQVDLAKYGETITLGEDDKKHILINSDGVNIYNGLNSLASYGTAIRIGQLENSHIILDSNSFNAYGANNASYFNLSDGSTIVSQSYNVATLPLTITTSHVIEEILELKINNVLQSETAYSFTDETNTVIINDRPPTAITIDIKYSYSDDNNELQEISQSFSYDAVSLTFQLEYDASTINSVSHSPYTISGNNITFSQRPNSGSTILIQYTLSKASPYFTFNQRKSNSTLGSGSASFGNNTTASGESSFVTGMDNTASGKASFVNGRANTASADSSSAFGIGTNSSAQGGMAVGRYNVADSSKLFSVGNGTSSARSNAFSVGTNGMVNIGGRLNGKDGSQMFLTGTFTSAKASIAAGASNRFTVSIKKTGYIPIVFSWVRVQGTGGQKFNIYETAINLTENKAYISVTNMDSVARSVNVQFRIFYILSKAVWG